MQIYKIIFSNGIAIAITNSVEQAIELANKNEVIHEKIDESNIYYVNDYYVIGGEPKLISVYIK